ncbi:hypothetical protein CCR75_000075 [Bremia lactucae]|uniref:Uncharacterized protein n=1 Tax=Bremia lactucae TaxID=4779 RepID=A0A976FHN6_BRELC|nr:hypothetical protein CCR75_000075 [Bremia lactucae]
MLRMSRAVETYLRNYEGDEAHHQEILEITLCYGVQCLVRTFSLKGISRNELRAITNYDTAKTRDYHVRHAFSRKNSNTIVPQRTPLEVHSKPSHLWRDGEADALDILKPTDAGPLKIKPASKIDEAALFSLPPTCKQFDFYAKVLAKQLLDLVWKTLVRRDKVQICTRQGLDDMFLRISRMKAPPSMPIVSFPVISLADFLGAYVTECVRHSHETGQSDIQSSKEEGTGATDKIATICRFKDSQASAREPHQRNGYTLRASKDKTKSSADAKSTHRSIHPHIQQRHQRQIPPSLQLKSKNHPELNSRLQKLLRVKKTHSQRIGESLAQARLAEYDARRELQSVRTRHHVPKRMPIGRATKGLPKQTRSKFGTADFCNLVIIGATASEIVNEFIKSPLMDTFGRRTLMEPCNMKPTIREIELQISAQDDFLAEELYGKAAKDGFFHGCEPAYHPQLRKEKASKFSKPSNGGPLHTKTGRPEWEEADYDAAEPESFVKGDNFEWNFEHPSAGRQHLISEQKLHASESPTSSIFKNRESFDYDRQLVEDLDENSSDGLSVNLDPVFRWLPNAV